ncbi:hypothetical protein HDU96_010188 [Phlyctochytrium bullatum]|nr:hypothetical protein HDU96_010188 [Phlyctochytrium bullatum]
MQSYPVRDPATPTALRQGHPLTPKPSPPDRSRTISNVHNVLDDEEREDAIAEDTCDIGVEEEQRGEDEAVQDGDEVGASVSATINSLAGRSLIGPANPTADVNRKGKEKMKANKALCHTMQRRGTARLGTQPDPVYEDSDDRTLYRDADAVIASRSAKIEETSTICLITVGIMRVLWKGNDWPTHQQRLYTERQNIRNIKAAAKRMLENGTNLGAFENPAAEDVIENWPKMVDRRKSINENIAAVHEYLQRHFRRKFGKNFTVYNITDRNCIPKSPGKGRKKRKVAMEDVVSEKEQADAAEQIKDGI